MSQNFNTLDTEYGARKGTVVRYIIGFAFSVLLTILAYGTVALHLFSVSTTFAIIILLALTQLFIQLIYFLHLGRSSHGRWNIIALVFTITIVSILVVGTLWVMNNLTDRTMNPMRNDGSVKAQNAY